MKYIVEAGTFVTRYAARRMIIYAKNAEEAKEKARNKFYEIEMRRADASDTGTIEINEIVEAD